MSQIKDELNSINDILLRYKKPNPFDNNKVIDPKPNQYGEIKPPRPDDAPIKLENRMIICNHEFASILLSLAQKAVNTVKARN